MRTRMSSWPVLASAVLFALLGIFGPAVAQAATTEPDTPEIWMCHREMHKLLEDPEAWSYVREHLDGIQLYIGQLQRYSPEVLEGLATMAAEADLQVAVECGGTLDFGPMDESNGAWSAETELRNFKNYSDVGGRIDFLNLDGPIRRLLYPTGDREGFDDYAACAEQLVIYMQAVREVYPEIRFFLLTNFPNWGYRGDVSYHARGPERQDWGDYHAVLEAVLPVIQAAGMPLVALSIDNPYEYARGMHHSVSLEDPTTIDWAARIDRLQADVRAEGLEVNMIINSQAGGNSSDAAFHDETLAYLDWYLERVSPPDRIYIQSWYDHPEALLPETEHGSMTALLRDVLLRLRPATN